MPTITVPEETFQRLSRRADAMKTTVDAIAEQLLRDEPVIGSGETGLPHAEWRKNFDAVLQLAQQRASRYPNGFEADISRDAIYEDESR